MSRCSWNVFLVLLGAALAMACGDDPADEIEVLCGDGVLDQGEECDGDDLAGMSCTDFGFWEGGLACSEDCTFDTAGCSGYCGDDQRDGPEECDGEDMAEASCTDLGFYGGELACGLDCTFDDSGCEHGHCGDTLVNGPEECDGENLDMMSCEALGYYYGGELACDEGCLFDVSGCQGGFCGDEEINGPEECDGAELGDAGCADFDFYRGQLACSDSCTFDTSACEGYCGDGVVDDAQGEACDDGINDGVYGCATDCSDRAPRYCGDGEINGDEECDGGLGDSSCESLGYLTGELRCDDDCRYDESGCVPDWSCGEPLTDSRDGKQYPTLELGGLCWMGANLDVGVRVDTGQSQLDQEVIEKYCYADDPANCETYGALYQWNQAMGYASEEGAAGICPANWRIPTDEEWKALEVALGMTRAEADMANTWRGPGVGPALQVGGSSGFEARLGGGRWSNGDSNWMGQMGYFWTSTMGATGPWRRCLSATAQYADEVGRWDTFPGSFGMSLRCVTD